MKSLISNQAVADRYWFIGKSLVRLAVDWLKLLANFECIIRKTIYNLTFTYLATYSARRFTMRDTSIAVCNQSVSVSRCCDRRLQSAPFLIVVVWRRESFGWFCIQGFGHVKLRKLDANLAHFSQWRYFRVVLIGLWDGIVDVDTTLAPKPIGGNFNQST